MFSTTVLSPQRSSRAKEHTAGWVGTDAAGPTGTAGCPAGDPWPSQGLAALFAEVWGYFFFLGFTGPAFHP